MTAEGQIGTIGAPVLVPYQEITRRGSILNVARDALTTRGTVVVLVPISQKHDWDPARVLRFRFCEDRTTGSPVAFC
ncbi:MAG: hypothetical protein JWQ74_3620 [Marmoricola sp.]|nr:hypothetical protein [Marmoricola sp.]